MNKSLLTLSLVCLISASLSSQAAPVITSIYSDLSSANCKTLESHVDEGGWYKGRCQGIGGYNLLVMEGDLRQTLTVLDPKNKEFPLELWTTVSSNFSSLGEKAEWRVKKQGNKTQLLALIVRFNAAENPAKPEENTSYLVVSKITAKEICVTDVVKPVANANEIARKLADQTESKACKK